jgi:UDP-GlcNAc:undecaprenyl-phosphate GlcNAc-1-phosphate transferase
MFGLSKLAITAGLVSAAIAYLATPLVIKFAQKIGIIDDPKKHKHPKVIHTYPVPRGGGLAIFAAVFIASLIFLPFDKHLKGILAGIFFLTTIGILDDKYDLNPYLRLAAGFFAASLPIAAGIGISFISNPFNGIIDLSHPQIVFEFLGETRSIWVISDIFALFWIVFLMNILNMGAKGVDGQLSGTVAIAAIVIALLSLKFSADITQWPIILLAAIVAGAYLGFLPWHIYPQKIMPGYGGASLAGFLLAVLSILSTTKVGTLMVVLGVPMVDTGYTIVRRILSKKSPVWGDRGHLHHKLLDAGLTKKQVAYFYWLVTAILGCLALYLNTSSKLYTMIGVTVLIGGLLLWLTYRPKSLK